jgi:hypothetical protein
MESVPEKRFSGQNLAVCFWIEVEDLPNILFPQASVNPWFVHRGKVEDVTKNLQQRNVYAAAVEESV